MEDTIRYLQDRFKEEQARFDHFENKCAKFLTAVSIVIVGLSGLAGFKNGALFKSDTPTSMLMLITFILAAFCIACSWGHALSALRINDCPSLPSSRMTAEYLRDVSDDLKQRHIYNCYVDTLEKLKKAIDEKSKPLEHAYNELVMGACLIFILAVLTLIRELAA
ncbi:hypothetical protein SRABI70_02830 [Pseudomonas sp. Bi70]|uniref:hypothetical protein n=1 Tax=Pseudomonas sp. Bi70 TaxID=2821127 RepID=UPI001DA9DA11|nr:hypothetical protein [Pseudomonas sp. Bi70]CAH0245491.1 hypothetical protein SRABI70_02830 [Pseudomonas sp. Bi70]